MTTAHTFQICTTSFKIGKVIRVIIEPRQSGQSFLRNVLCYILVSCAGPRINLRSHLLLGRLWGIFFYCSQSFIELIRLMLLRAFIDKKTGFEPVSTCNRQG